MYLGFHHINVKSFSQPWRSVLISIADKSWSSTPPGWDTSLSKVNLQHNLGTQLQLSGLRRYIFHTMPCLYKCTIQNIKWPQKGLNQRSLSYWHSVYDHLLMPMSSPPPNRCICCLVITVLQRIKQHSLCSKRFP